jgi:hypothetical protein
VATDYKYLLPRIGKLIASRRCVLFVGAGISRTAKIAEPLNSDQFLPTWPDLLMLLLKQAAESSYLEAEEFSTLTQAVQDKKFLFVAEAIKKRMGSKEFDDSLERIFRNPNLKPNNRHKLITELPFQAIITTNYDKLIETAYAQIAIPPVYCYDNSSDVIASLAANKFFILKAHGDIDRKDTIILTERDYRNMVYRQPGYRAALNSMFIMKTVLFIGSSLSDTDINLVLETVSEAFTAKGTRHYALVPEGGTGSEEVQHWREFFGIQILTYQASDGHPEIDVFLQSLVTQLSPLGSTPPA